MPDFVSTANTFNLPNHLVSLGRKYFDSFPQDRLKSLETKILEENGKVGCVYTLDDLTWWPDEKDMAEKAPAKCQNPQKIAMVRKILQDFSNNGSQISQDLRKILNNTDFTIAIRPREQWPKPNGGAVFQKGNDGARNKAVLFVAETLFDDFNKDILPGLLAHEMGHFIDFYNRPQNENAKQQYMDGAETFADTMGVLIAQSAGYNCDGWAKYLRDEALRGHNPPHTHSGLHRSIAICEISTACDLFNRDTSKNMFRNRVQALRGLGPVSQVPSNPHSTMRDNNLLRSYLNRKQNA